jgi:hypothetical protein
MKTRQRIAERLRTMDRRTRRLLVLETLISYPLVVIGYSALVATGRVPGALWAPIAIVLMAGFVSGLFVVYAYAGGRADPRNAELDERQRGLAIEAWALSFGALTWFLVIVAVAWAVWVTFVGPVLVGPELLLPVAIGVGVYLPLLPLAALTWIEPDAPAEEPEDAIAGRPVR